MLAYLHLGIGKGHLVGEPINRSEGVFKRTAVYLLNITALSLLGHAALLVTCFRRSADTKLHSRLGTVEIVQEALLSWRHYKRVCG